MSKPAGVASKRRPLEKSTVQVPPLACLSRRRSPAGILSKLRPLGKVHSSSPPGCGRSKSARFKSNSGCFFRSGGRSKSSRFKSPRRRCCPGPQAFLRSGGRSKSSRFKSPRRRFSPGPQALLRNGGRSNSPRFKSARHRSWTRRRIHEAVVDQLHTKHQVEEGMTDKILGVHDSHSDITMHARCMGFTKINHILRAEVSTGQPRARERRQTARTQRSPCTRGAWVSPRLTTFCEQRWAQGSRGPESEARQHEAGPNKDIEHQTAAAQRRQTKHLCAASNSEGGENRTLQKKASRGFEPRSLDSESRVLTVTPRGLVFIFGHHSVILRARRAGE